MARVARPSLVSGARIALVVLSLVGAAWLATLDFSAKISTNVVDLLPADERDPDLQLLRSLVNDSQARVVLAVLRSGAEKKPSESALDAFIASLLADAAFAEVVRADDAGPQRELGRFLFEHRLLYLLPAWLEARWETFSKTNGQPDEWAGWLAERVATDLDAFLMQPESAAFDELVTADPLLLVPALVQDASRLAPPREMAENAALIWARTSASPLEPEGQQPVFDAMQAALDRARKIDPDVTLDWAGVSRFAAASKERIRQEFSWLNLLAVGAVLLSTAVLMRRPWRAVHLLPAVFVSSLGAWVGVTMAFERVHIIVFVLGALLSGAAVDYGFHLGVHATGRTGSLRRVLKPLLASCLTTVLGFAILGFSDLPVLRHLGVFVCAGLISALAAALLYFLQQPSATIEPRAWPATGESPRLRILGIVLGIIAAFGITRITWRDDVRLLEVPAPELMKNDETVRMTFGQGPDTTAYLVRGDSWFELRTRADALQAWHAEQFPETNLLGPALLVPSPRLIESARERLALLDEFPRALATALENHGFTADAFDPFFDSWREQTEEGWPSSAELAAQLRTNLQGTLAQSWGESGRHVWMLAFSHHPPGAVLPPDLPATELSQLRSLNQLFERYRHQAVILSVVGLLLLGTAVCVAYGIRRGLQVFLVPAGAVLVAFGLLGWFSGPLNLFHLLGAFLGVCLSHDYAIFDAEVRAPGEPPPASIRLSALTTAASFGVLALSRVPVISALGISVTLMVLIALLWVELRPAPRPAVET